MGDPQLPNFDALWDYDDPAATHVKFMGVLDSLDEPQRCGEYGLALQSQIARTLGLVRKFEEAHALLDRVEKSITPQMPLAMVRYLLERGRVFNSSGERERSRPLFERAFDLGRENHLDYYTIDAAHMLGIVAGGTEAQLDWNRVALEHAQRTNDERARRWAGSLYNNIGWTHFDAANYAEALAIFEKSVEFYSEGNVDHRLWIARYAVAKTLRMMGRVDEALAIDLAVAEERRAAGAESGGGYVAEEIAECLLLLGRTEESRQYFAIAYELISKDAWTVQHEPQRLERLRLLSLAKPKS